jgi:hypothetical protein
MGCRIGKWVFLETTFFSEFDLVEIGDHANVNFGATIQTHLFEDRVMKADYLRIGEGCTVGNMAVVLYGTHMRRGSSLGPMSLLMKGETLPAGSHWHGIPSEPIETPRPPVPRRRPGLIRRAVRFTVRLPGRGMQALGRRLQRNMEHMTPPGRRLAAGLASGCDVLAGGLGAGPETRSK